MTDELERAIYLFMGLVSVYIIVRMIEAIALICNIAGGI